MLRATLCQQLLTSATQCCFAPAKLPSRPLIVTDAQLILALTTYGSMGSFVDEHHKGMHAYNELTQSVPEADSFNDSSSFPNSELRGKSSKGSKTFRRAYTGMHAHPILPATCPQRLYMYKHCVHSLNHLWPCMLLVRRGVA